MLRRLPRSLLAALASVPVLASAAPPVVDVYENPACGCCKAWIKHLQANGLQARVHEVASPDDIRAKLGLPGDLGSCHSATVDGYFIEGHVPAAEIKRLLAERPKAKGLSVPEMPRGSPGMESMRREPYDVLLVRPDGKTTVYKHYN